MATNDGRNSRNGGSWRKYFKVADVNQLGQLSPISGKNNFGLPGYNRNSGDFESGSRNEFAFRNYASRLPEVYSGHPNRLERYNQYENMDCDSEVNACLDIIAEFSTQQNSDNGTPFDIKFTNKPTDHEIEIIKKQLQQWTKLNKLDQRIFKLFRNTIKYGDQVFVRDPETFEMYWVDMIKVARIIVNESEGKRPEQYIIRDINPNFQNMSMAAKTTSDYYVSRSTGSVTTGNNYNAPNGGSGGGGGGGVGNSRFTQAMNESCIDSKHVVHLSLNEGLDYFWPFGQSILENIYKVYKQKELLEDSILIYRVQRAPERRLFKIDVGNMPSHMAMAFVERVKNEMHQRRIPTISGGGANMMDASYNALSVNEDYFFPQTSDGRGSSIEVLPGGCFSMDTSVSLLDGRELTIAQVSDELAEGKTLWVYSCEPITGKVVPGLVSWAGMTQRQAQVLKITLDNGESIICTPDHKFPQYDVEFKRADELTVGDSLIPLYRKKEVCDTKLDGYEEYFDNSSKQWKYTHRMVADEFKDTLVKYKIFNEEYSDGKYDVRHHVNFNRHDNSPENLCWMAWHDHQKLHQHHGFSKESQQLGTLAAKRRLQNLKDNNLAEYEKYCKTVGERFTNWYSSLTEEELVELNENKAAGLKKYFESLDDDSKAIRTANSRAAFKIANKTKLEKMAKDEEYRQWVCEQQKAGWTSELREERSKFVSDRNLKDWKNNEKRRSNMKELQSVSYSHSMLKSVIDMVKDKTTHEITVNDIIDELNKNINIVNELAILNKDKKVRNWSIDKGFTATGLTSMVKQYGYTSWSDFRKKESVHNHRIAKIEYLDEPMDVGTLTIDGDEIYHGYHTFALSAGVFTKNSNLGEIDDLKYFNNKMARGLRVPSSYLPTGPDDSGAATNDGRVGTALIQEFRFNKYCERLQKLIMQKLDDEFKMYMRWRGFEIDNGLFDITLTEPQNFASYRQSELDTARVATFASLEPLNYLSKRFTLKRFLGLSDEEILENETLWKEERDNPQMQAQQGQGLRSVGITPGGLSSDLDMNTDLTNTDLGSAEVDTGAGPAPAVVPTPGAPSGGPAGL